MINYIYQIRDKVSQTFKFVLCSNNDASAIRDTCDMLRGNSHYSDFELWRFDYGFDKETGLPVTAERAVIALPPLASEAPKMPVGAGAPVTVQPKM